VDLIRQRLFRLKKLLKKESIAHLLEFDSDEDYSEISIKKEEKFDYLVEKTPLQIRIADSIEELHLIKGIKAKFRKWITHDDPALGSFIKMKEGLEGKLEYLGVI
jgi:hypothetical protein